LKKKTSLAVWFNANKEICGNCFVTFSNTFMKVISDKLNAITFTFHSAYDFPVMTGLFIELKCSAIKI